MKLTTRQQEINDLAFNTGRKQGKIENRKQYDLYDLIFRRTWITLGAFMLICLCFAVGFNIK